MSTQQIPAQLDLLEWLEENGAPWWKPKTPPANTTEKDKNKALSA